MHETAIVNYSKAKSISSPMCRNEGENPAPHFVSVTCLINITSILGSRATSSNTKLLLKTYYLAQQGTKWQVTVL